MRPLISDVSLTFTRYGGQTISPGGSVTRTTPQTIAVRGSLQPFRLGDVTTVLPEGKRAEDARMFYTKTRLRASNSVTQTPADTVVINGEVFEVFNNGDWATTTILTGLSHYKVILLRQGQNGG